MPDCPHENQITSEAKKAQLALQKFKDKNAPTFDLDLDLQVVADNLSLIAQDNHKAQ